MRVLAYDFGASSGRAILGEYTNGRLELKEIHRFDNEPVEMNGGFYWDLPRLFREIKEGLVKAEPYGYESIGADTWGVDYGLLTPDGLLLGNPYHYRDSRTGKLFKEVNARIGAGRLYRMSGIQALDFNTMYQLLETKQNHGGFYDLADKILLMPDLFGYLLTGKMWAERSIASTTQLLEPRTREWNTELMELLGLNKDLFPQLVDAGTVVGELSPELCAELAITPKKMIAVAEHDTASAVAAVPAKDKDFVYISCGTWSLFGAELKEPCITEVSEKMNITNESGYGRSVRFLKNIIGLWMIQETRRQFKRRGKDYSYSDMERLARAAEPFKCFIDPDDPRFAPPGDQITRIRDYCRETGQYVPSSDGEVIRCIYESLAMKYKHTFEQLKECLGKDFTSIHMVGGGTKDGFLCGMTADAVGVPVTAGPIEATAIGNIAVQLITLGEIKDLAEAREIIARSFSPEYYYPKDSGFDEKYSGFKKLVRG